MAILRRKLKVKHKKAKKTRIMLKRVKAEISTTNHIEGKGL